MEVWLIYVFTQQLQVRSEQVQIATFHHDEAYVSIVGCVSSVLHQFLVCYIFLCCFLSCSLVSLPSLKVTTEEKGEEWNSNKWSSSADSRVSVCLNAGQVWNKTCSSKALLLPIFYMCYCMNLDALFVCLKMWSVGLLGETQWCLCCKIWRVILNVDLWSCRKPEQSPWITKKKKYVELHNCQSAECWQMCVSRWWSQAQFSPWKQTFMATQPCFYMLLEARSPRPLPDLKTKINFHRKFSTSRLFKVVQERKKFFINIKEAAPLSQSSFSLYRRVIVWLTGQTCVRVKRSRYGFRFAPCRPQQTKDPTKDMHAQTQLWGQ